MLLAGVNSKWNTYVLTSIKIIRSGKLISSLIDKTTNVMQLGAIVFVIPWKTLYMFRVLFTPIIRSVL
jgi:hypothetical protein